MAGIFGQFFTVLQLYCPFSIKRHRVGTNNGTLVDGVEILDN